MTDYADNLVSFPQYGYTLQLAHNCIKIRRDGFKCYGSFAWSGRTEATAAFHFLANLLLVSKQAFIEYFSKYAPTEGDGGLIPQINAKFNIDFILGSIKDLKPLQVEINEFTQQYKNEKYGSSYEDVAAHWQ